MGIFIILALAVTLTEICAGQVLHSAGASRRRTVCFALASDHLHDGFAADNTEFAEDTPNGKGTTHETIIVVCQKDTPSGEPIAEPLAIGEAKSLTVTPYHVDILY